MYRFDRKRAAALACFVLLLFVFMTPKDAFAQDETGGPAFSVKARASVIFFSDRGDNSFGYAPSGAVGLHFGVSKEFGRWAVATGIGADRMSFVQRTTDFPYSRVEESVVLRMHYFSLQVPVTAHYAVSDRFGATAGLNVVAANLNAYAISVSSGTLGSSGFQSSQRDDFPGYQLTAELHAGAAYDLSTRIALAAHVNFGLHSLNGVGLRFDSEEAGPSNESFEYEWFRTGIELIYRFK